MDLNKTLSTKSPHSFSLSLSHQHTFNQLSGIHTDEWNSIRYLLPSDRCVEAHVHCFSMMCVDTREVLYGTSNIISRSNTCAAHVFVKLCAEHVCILSLVLNFLEGVSIHIYTIVHWLQWYYSNSKRWCVCVLIRIRNRTQAEI